MKNKYMVYIVICVILSVSLTVSVGAIGSTHWSVDFVDFSYNNGLLYESRSDITDTEIITRGEFTYNHIFPT